MEDTRKATIEELDRAQRMKERQVQGGTDLDTTNLDQPGGLQRPGEDMIGEDLGEHGPLTTAPAEKDLLAPMGPSGEDPFVPGTGVKPDYMNDDVLESDREKWLHEEVHKKDPEGDKGPTYERGQGDAPQQLGGSTDPNSGRTEETSGLLKDRDV